MIHTTLITSWDLMNYFSHRLHAALQDELLNAFFIKSVKPGSVAANAGFEAGDRIDEISHDGIPMGRGGKKLAFRLHGKTLGQVTAEILRGISTQQPVHFKVGPCVLLCSLCLVARAPPPRRMLVLHCRLLQSHFQPFSLFRRTPARSAAPLRRWIVALIVNAVLLQVSKQKIAMEAQQQLKDEEEAEARHALEYAPSSVLLCAANLGASFYLVEHQLGFVSNLEVLLLAHISNAT